MDVSTFSDDLRRYLTLILHWTWLVVLVTILSGAAAYLISMRTTPIYQAVTKVLINEAPTSKSADYASVLTSERLAKTYAELLKTEPVIEGVIEELGLSRSVTSLKGGIQVEPVRDTQLIEIRLSDTDPVRAANILNSLFVVFDEMNLERQTDRFSTSKKNLEDQLTDMGDRISETSAALNDIGDNSSKQTERTRLETDLAQYRQLYSNLLLSYEQVRLTEAQSTSTLTQIEVAIPPTVPIRPRTTINTLVASVVGFIVALGVVFLIEALDITIKNPEDVARHLGLPVLGFVARHDKNLAVVTAEQPRSPISEAFRSLRTNLQFASVDYPIHTLLITSPSPAEGKTTIAINLGAILAQGGLKTSLVDADLRRPNVHKVLGLSNRRGLSSLFVNPNADVSTNLQQTATANFTVLTAGEVPPNPSELLGSTKMIELLGKLEEFADVIVIDSPPIMAVTDSAVLAPKVDGVLLIVKPGSTHMMAAKQAVEQLRRVGANILGVVLNEVDIGASRYRYYRYKGYYYAHSHYFDNDETIMYRSKKPQVVKRRINTSKRTYK